MSSTISKAEPAFGGATVVRIAAVWAWILVWVATPGAEMRWIDIERSTVMVYFSASGARRAAAPSHVIEVPLAEGSVDDTDTPHLALVINVGQLRVVDPGRSADERQKVRAQMLGPEGLDAERFSRITYHSLTIDRIEAGVWLVQGELEMHGRFLPLNARAVRQGGSLHRHDDGVADRLRDTADARRGGLGTSRQRGAGRLRHRSGSALSRGTPRQWLPMSWRVQMCGWFKAATVRASRSNRCFRSESAATYSGSTLMATVRARRVSRAL